MQFFQTYPQKASKPVRLWLNLLTATWMGTRDKTYVSANQSTGLDRAILQKKLKNEKLMKIQLDSVSQSFIHLSCSTAHKLSYFLARRLFYFFWVTRLALASNSLSFRLSISVSAPRYTLFCACEICKENTNITRYVSFCTFSLRNFKIFGFKIHLYFQIAFFKLNNLRSCQCQQQP